MAKIYDLFTGKLVADLPPVSMVSSDILTGKGKLTKSETMALHLSIRDCNDYLNLQEADWNTEIDLVEQYLLKCKSRLEHSIKRLKKGA